jgi:histidinol-phosphatase
MPSPAATSRPPPSNPGPRATEAVTDADQEIEIVLRPLIRQEDPDGAFIGEEFGAHGHGRRRWIIDAIDGTASFLAGEPEWSTLIAVEEDSHISLGMVSAPALGRR